MSKPIQLHIPKPCHENWKQMTKSEKGKFCGACQKEVVDFTGMSDEQLGAFFRKPPGGSVCGRFMRDQLNRNIELPKKRIPWAKYLFQFALPAFLASSKISAQGKIAVMKGEPIVIAKFPGDEPEKQRVTSEKRTEKVIRGRVVDEDSVAVPYASVMLRGTTIGVAADSSGFFSIKYDGLEDGCTLVTSSVGYNSVETMVDLNKLNTSVTMPMLSQSIMGLIVQDTEIFPPRELMHVDTSEIATPVAKKISDSLRNMFFSKRNPLVFPNPIKNNSTQNIEIITHENGTYLAQIVAMNGQVILRKEILVDNHNYPVRLPVPAIPSGTYVLQMNNKKSGRTYAEKIIVE